MLLETDGVGTNNVAVIASRDELFVVPLMILGSPENTRVTIHFLNSILEDQPRITEVEILNPFLGKDSEDDTLSVLDSLTADEHARLLKSEMQNNWHRVKGADSRFVGIRQQVPV